MFGKSLIQKRLHPKIHKTCKFKKINKINPTVKKDLLYGYLNHCT